MKYLLVLLLCSSVFAAPYRVGESVANKCWEDALGKKTCLSDFKGETAVLLFNAGWCGPCNDEFKGIVKAMEKYSPPLKHEVVFLSLSCDGWSNGSGPSVSFLKEWDAKFRLSNGKPTFLVLASPRDCGRDFFSSPSIPNVAIISETGHLNWKGIGPSYKKISEEINWAVKP